ncbi:MAG: DUF1987 domain-containing protein [Bacteroidales bacterium]|nr:DUF1987 domain-containing protein [Bacteroidales bacterium]
MNPLVIPATIDSPAVNLDKEKQIFEIKGKSLPENVNVFYQPIIDWFTEYFKNPNEETILHFKLDYLNTASSKALLSLFLVVEEAIKNGRKAIVKWYYEEDDEDMKDIGEEYADIIQIPFEIIQIDNE